MKMSAAVSPTPSPATMEPPALNFERKLNNGNTDNSYNIGLNPNKKQPRPMSMHLTKQEQHMLRAGENDMDPFPELTRQQSCRPKSFDSRPKWQQQTRPKFDQMHVDAWKNNSVRKDNSTTQVSTSRMSSDDSLGEVDEHQHKTRINIGAFDQFRQHQYSLSKRKDDIPRQLIARKWTNRVLHQTPDSIVDAMKKLKWHAWSEELVCIRRPTSKEVFEAAETCTQLTKVPGWAAFEKELLYNNGGMLRSSTTRTLVNKHGAKATLLWEYLPSWNMFRPGGTLRCYLLVVC
jgi:hypothetical protein